MANPPHLADRRIALGLTQARLGELIGVDQSAVSRIETGNSQGEHLVRLLETLDALEHDRDNNIRAKTAAFWDEAKTAPNARFISKKVAEVAEILLSGPLSSVELGMTLSDCLPARQRAALLRRHAQRTDGSAPSIRPQAWRRIPSR